MASLKDARSILTSAAWRSCAMLLRGIHGFAPPVFTGLALIGAMLLMLTALSPGTANPGNSTAC